MSEQQERNNLNCDILRTACLWQKQPGRKMAKLQVHLERKGTLDQLCLITKKLGQAQDAWRKTSGLDINAKTLLAEYCKTTWARAAQLDW